MASAVVSTTVAAGPGPQDTTRHRSHVPRISGFVSMVRRVERVEHPKISRRASNLKAMSSDSRASCSTGTGLAVSRSSQAVGYGQTKFRPTGESSARPYPTKGYNGRDPQRRAEENGGGGPWRHSPGGQEHMLCEARKVWRAYRSEISR